MAKFIMMVGIPGSGKSSIVSKYSEQGYVISCPDTFRGIFSATHDEADQTVNKQAWEAATKLVVTSLSDNKNVVLDATEVYRQGRQNFLRSLPPCNTKAVYIKVQLETALYRNTLRGTDNGKRSQPVPDEVITRMFNNLVEPSITEGFDEIEVIVND